MFQRIEFRGCFAEVGYWTCGLLRVPAIRVDLLLCGHSNRSVASEAKFQDALRGVRLRLYLWFLPIRIILNFGQRYKTPASDSNGG